MKSYPSISKEIIKGLDIYAFGKIDGSNIRAEYSKKKGFYKFGSRNQLITDEQGVLNKAKDLIINNFSDPTLQIIKKQRWERVILFFEFAGSKSFAGIHEENDSHDVWLIDANPYKKGILPPNEFLSIFGDLNTAPLLYHGKCNDEFVESVKFSRLQGMPEEGVVCKAKNPKDKHCPIMFKIKSHRWLERLKEKFSGDEKMFERLI